MNVVWRAAASADLARIIRHIAEEIPVAARQMARELVLTGDSLTLFPYRGRLGRAEGTHELVVVRPYILVYEVDGANVTILRVWHGAQVREE